MSGKKVGADGAIILMPEIVANGALVKFDVSKNSLYANGTKVVARALAGNQMMTELSISGNHMTYDGCNNSGDMSGVIAISNSIPTMGALSSLNISANSLGRYFDVYKREWVSDMSAIKALAAALPECK